MPRPHKFDPTKPPVGQRRCPTCGLPMFLSQIEPSERARDEDLSTFECQQCAYAETVVIQFS
jgi:hypothetical protein